MKFGVREICDVTFKTTAANQKVGETLFANAYTPAFFIDTAKTSTMEQATTTVYATGGRGNNRLIAWEGEKTMTFTVEDALISPMGLAVLSGAGLMKASEDNVKHVHITLDVNVTNSKGSITLADLQAETGLNAVTEFTVCRTTPAYAIGLDGSGAGIAYYQNVNLGGKTDIVVSEGSPLEFTIEDATVNGAVKLDFYLIMNSGITEVVIEPGSFGGYFYVEAQTLFRREDSGQDMAAEIIFPRVKVQSGFTFTMASSGDPSTFTFTMDAFPGYTQFDKTKKVNCAIQVLGDDASATEDEAGTHTHPVTDESSFTINIVGESDSVVTPNVTEAKEGETISLSVELGTATKVTLSSTEVSDLSQTEFLAGGTATFTMPANNVTITVTEE